jgi:hypothetical protein
MVVMEANLMFLQSVEHQKTMRNCHNYSNIYAVNGGGMKIQLSIIRVPCGL